MDFRFTNEYNSSRLDEIVDYLRGPRLWIPCNDYPDFNEWLQKVHNELRTETKRAVIALSQNQIAGVVIYQRHKNIADTIELKNLTIRPDQRGRYIASFLIRNAEIEGLRDFGLTRMLCDSKANNWAIRLFLLRHHYSIVTEEDLYKLGTGKDIIYQKDLHLLRI